MDEKLDELLNEFYGLAKASDVESIILNTQHSVKVLKELDPARHSGRIDEVRAYMGELGSGPSAVWNDWVRKNMPERESEMLLPINKSHGR